jgi:hypothetical protein
MDDKLSALNRIGRRWRMAIPFGQVETLVLDHLGVVAAVVRELGLVEKIDRRLPVTDRAKVSIPVLR